MVIDTVLVGKGFIIRPYLFTSGIKSAPFRIPLPRIRVLSKISPFRGAGRKAIGGDTE